MAAISRAMSSIVLPRAHDSGQVCQARSDRLAHLSFPQRDLASLGGK